MVYSDCAEISFILYTNEISSIFGKGCITSVSILIITIPEPPEPPPSPLGPEA